MGNVDKLKGFKTYLIVQWLIVFIIMILIAGNDPNINVGAGFFGAIFIASIGVGIFLIYFLPTIAAIQNDNIQSVGIMILNIFLGWTLVGWVMALVWAYSKPNVQVQYSQSNSVNIHQQNLTIIKELTILDELKSKGSLSEDEYLDLKARLLNPKP